MRPSASSCVLCRFGTSSVPSFVIFKHFAPSVASRMFSFELYSMFWLFPLIYQETNQTSFVWTVAEKLIPLSNNLSSSSALKLRTGHLTFCCSLKILDWYILISVKHNINSAISLSFSQHHVQDRLHQSWPAQSYNLCIRLIPSMTVADEVVISSARATIFPKVDLSFFRRDPCWVARAHGRCPMGCANTSSIWRTWF